MRNIDEITRLIEVYPPRWRRWCDAPENGGCSCLGCVRWPAPTTVRGDPEGQPFPNPSDALTKEEVALYSERLPEGLEWGPWHVTWGDKLIHPKR